MNKILELIKKAEDKVNSTMLSNIRKTEINLILLEIQKEALTIPVVVGRSEQLVCSCGTIKVQTTGGSQCPNNRCSSAN